MIQLRFTKTKGLWLLIVVTECFKVIEGGKLLYTIDMEKQHEQQWVDVHNEYRRLVSNPEASNMRLMTWDYGLAQLAKTVVSTCDFTHTSLDAMATSLFPEAGENLYAGDLYKFPDLIRGVTKLWYDEIEFYNHTQASCDENRVCGHYTQLVWAVTYKIGCAVGKCKSIENGHGSHLVACNYGPTGNKYLEGTRSPPYESGESCSNCGEGDGCIDQLCNNTARDIPLSWPLTSTLPEITTSSPEIVTSSPGIVTSLPEIVTSSPETDDTNIVCFNGTCVTINGTFPTTTGAATITRSCDFVNIACFFLSGLLLNFATA